MVRARLRATFKEPWYADEKDNGRTSILSHFACRCVACEEVLFDPPGGILIKRVSLYRQLYHIAAVYANRQHTRKQSRLRWWALHRYSCANMPSPQGNS